MEPKTKIDSVTGSKDLQRYSLIYDFEQSLSINDRGKIVRFKALDVLWSSDHSSKQMVSGVCHTADTIHFEKLAAIHASNSLTLTQTPLNHHLGKFRPRKN